MSSLGSLNIQLSLDAVQFQQALSKSDHQTQKFVKNFTIDMDKARNSARQFANRTTEYLNNIETAAKNINRTAKFEFVLNNIGRIQSAAAQLIQLADSHTELSNRLKLVTESEVQHAQAMSSVYDISMKTAQSTQAVSAIYSSFSQNAKELGINQQQVASVTETISKAVAISGASVSEAQNALTQFSQTLLMGKMRSQEYNSIMTQTPAVMQAIARGLGVTMGELKQMSDEGKLTADKMIQALEKSKASVDELYGKTATTISGAMQNLSTATNKFVGELTNSIGLANGLSYVINGLAYNLNQVAPAALGMTSALVGIKLSERIKESHLFDQASRDIAKSQVYATKATLSRTTAELNATRAYISNLTAQMNLAATEKTRVALSLELQAQTARETLLIQQQTAATKQLAVAKRSASLLSGALSMIGGPLGLLSIGLATGVGYLYSWYHEAEQAKEKALAYADSIEQVRSNLEQMSAVQVTAETIKVKQSIQAQEEALAKLRQEQERLANSAKTTSEVIYDAFGGSYEVVKSAEELSRTNDELALKTAEVENAQNKLNQSLEWLSDLQAYEPVADLKEQFSALFPQVEESQIKIDGLNLSIGNFTITLPAASANALEFAKSISSIASVAMQAAVAVANLNNLSVNPLSDKAQSMIDRQKRQIAINNAKTPEEARRLKAEDAAINAGFKKGTADYDAVYNNSYALFKSQDDRNERNKTKSKSKGATDFVMTGKADFSAMAKSIIRDIVQMTVRMLFFRAISSAFGGFSSVDVGSAPIAGAATNMLGLFDSGGYTGDGGKYQPAGIVHRGEYVITKEATARLGRGFLDQLNYGAIRRGFANGGGVGVPRLPQVNYDASRSSGNISVKVINNGEPMEANVTQKQRNGQMEITVELMRQIARAESNEVIQQNMRAGGIFAR